LQADGTLVALGGGGDMECPPLYGGSGALGSVTRATATNLEVSAPYEVVNLTMEGSATIRGTVGLDLDIRVQGDFDASTCSSGKISMDGRGAQESGLPAGGAGSSGHTTGSSAGSAGGAGVMSSALGDTGWKVGGSLIETTGGGGGGSGATTSGSSSAGGDGGAGVASALTGGAAGAGGTGGSGVGGASNGNPGNNPGTVTGPSAFYRGAFLVGMKPPC
jgi:hypothetical protein